MGSKTKQKEEVMEEEESIDKFWRRLQYLGRVFRRLALGRLVYICINRCY